MLSSTLLVLARSTERARVLEIDGRTRWSSWRLMSELAVDVSTSQVEPALGVFGV